MPGKKRSRVSKKRLSMLKFSVDDLVFVKHKNRPFWPARIQEVPNEENKKYKVLFFGTREEINSLEKNILSYEENFSLYGEASDVPDFNDALWEAAHDPALIGLPKPNHMRQILESQYKEKSGNENVAATPTSPAAKQKTQTAEQTPKASKTKPLATKLPDDRYFTPPRQLTPSHHPSTCLALKVPNNTPLTPPKNARTRGQKRTSTEPQNVQTDAKLFIERIQALEEKQKMRKKSL